MMVEALEEFCTLALTLNYTQAARTLHLSQSTLSRHIKGLEDELGFKLVENIGGALRVTRPGAEFLNAVVPMVEQFRSTVERCRELSGTESYEMIIQEPPFQDVASIEFLKRIAEFKTLRPLIYTHYREVFSDFVKMLQRRDIDIVLEYRHKGLDDVSAHWDEFGLTSVLVAKAPLVVCCKSSSGLAGRESLSVADLADYSILVLYNNFSPARLAILELFQENGLTPSFINITAGSMLEYLASPLADNCIYVLPEGVEFNMRRLMRDDCEFIPIEGESVGLYAIFRPEYEEMTGLREFHDFLVQMSAGAGEEKPSEPSAQ